MSQAKIAIVTASIFGLLQPTYATVVTNLKGYEFTNSLVAGTLPNNIGIAMSSTGTLQLGRDLFLMQGSQRTIPSRNDIDEQIIEIIAEHLKVNRADVTPQKSFTQDLKADSLDLVELTMKVEEQFGIQIPDDDAEKLQTVGDAINYVKMRLRS